MKLGPNSDLGGRYFGYVTWMELYHVMNRGVERRNITVDNRDRLRFVRDLYEMNNGNPVNNLWYSLKNPARTSTPEIVEREQLVDIHAWCLMGNHYHLLVSERVEHGLSMFLMKFNMGYTKYFNLRHERSGVLYQGKTKRVLIEHEAHFLYILLYIHCNPLDFMKGAAAWRSQCISNPTAAIEWIQKYRWSSYRNYTGKAEFASILDGSELFKHRDDHKAEMRAYLKSLQSPELTSLYLE